MYESWFQILTIIISNLIILAFFGITISLPNGMREEIREMKNEMKDFHGRLWCMHERQNTDP